MEAYALKELKISSETLGTLTTALRNLGETHQLVEATVLKYWYETAQPEPHLPLDESVLEEYSTHAAVRVWWSAGSKQLGVQIMQHILKLEIKNADEMTTDRPLQ